MGVIMVCTDFGLVDDFVGGDVEDFEWRCDDIR